MRALAALIALTAVAAPALAQEAMPPAGTDWGTLLVSAIEANGCAMAEKDAPLLLTPHGFHEDWTYIVLEQLVKEGRATLTEVDGMPTVAVTSEVCA